MVMLVDLHYVEDLMKPLICSLLLLLSGCATMENYCDNHGKTCVLAGEAAVVVVVAVVAVKATDHNHVNVVQNPPPTK
jgi:hypothetical protein